MCKEIIKPNAKTNYQLVVSTVMQVYHAFKIKSEKRSEQIDVLVECGSQRTEDPGEFKGGENREKRQLG